jgi:hypothetical protein
LSVTQCHPANNESVTYLAAVFVHKNSSFFHIFLVNYSRFKIPKSILLYMPWNMVQALNTERNGMYKMVLQNLKGTNCFLKINLFPKNYLVLHSVMML